MSVPRSYKLSDAIWYAFFALLAPGAVEYQRVTEQPILPRFGRVCSRDDPEGGCPERMEAQARGDFFADFEAWGWVDKTIPLRKMSSQARYYVYSVRENDNHPDCSGQRFTFTVCPHCAQELPSMGLIRKYQEQIAHEQGDGA